MDTRGSGKGMLNVCGGYRVNSSLLSSSVLTSNNACGYCTGSSGQEVGTH